jgi:hypothetical protein
MAQPQTDGLMSMLDPFGFWKTYRDTSLEGWSKLMIDMVNTQEYARFTGQILDQYMTVAQPVQDAVQKSMVMLLPYFNLPSRDEVISVAERLVNIETRLDDLDAQTSDMSDEQIRGQRKVERDLDKVLSTLIARLDGLEAAIVPESKTQNKPEPKTGTAK